MSQDNMESILLSENINSKFSSLRGIDLQELLFQIENYDLEYRPSLCLPRKTTFKIEIEYDKLPKERVSQFIEENLKKWLSRDSNNLLFDGRIVSPIMKDNSRCWQEIKMICDFLKNNDADLSNTAGHILIDSSSLKTEKQSWIQFLKLYTAYEHIIFRFAYGDKLNGRKNVFKSASPMADDIHKNLKFVEQALDFDFFSDWYLPKYSFEAINFSNAGTIYYDIRKRNTIEFNSPNASTSPVIWQNYINAFAKMILTSSKNIMDDDFLDYKLKHEFIPFRGHEYLYDEINLRNALEFVDLVFDNNLDKVYFLRQYFKSFQENYGLKRTVKAKQFVK